MTSKTLSEVLHRVETWPEYEQEHAAQVLLDVEELYRRQSLLSDEQWEEVRRRMSDPDRVLLPLAEVKHYFAAKRGHASNNQ